MIDSALSEVTPGALRILVADDNEAVTKTFGWMLEVLGHEVRVAHDGVSTLAIARTFRPDVILLDISLPGMDGYEVCKKLRAEPGLEHILIIAQTGWGQPERRQHSLAAGFDHYLVKPVDINLLEDLLRKHQTTG